VKWLIGASLVGAGWCVAVLALSLSFGGALPITAMPMLASVGPAIVISIVGWARTSGGDDYRTLHRFGPGSRRLTLLFVGLGLVGVAFVIAGIGVGTPYLLGGDVYALGFKGHPPEMVSKSVYLAAVAAMTRLTTGVVLAVYSATGIALLLRMHYHPPH
jgi:hypothetical protein